MKNVQEVRTALKGLKGFKRELEKERARLKGSMKGLNRMARKGVIPDWSEDAMGLFRSPDFSYGKLMRLMRKNKIL